MLNFAINNEMTEAVTLPPFLINNPIYKGDSVMTEPNLSKSARTCQVEGCPRKFYAKGSCKRHYEQFRIKGETFGDPFYSHKDKNEFKVEGDVCKIELRDRRGQFKAYALIDASDLPLVRKYKWCVNKDNIVATRLNKKTMLSLWHLILGSPHEGAEVDHDNQNRLDNRRCNLRFATRLQNQSNLPTRPDSKTGFKGVNTHKGTGKYRARIGYKGGQIHLGVFVSKTDAAMAYNKKAVELFGEFASLNEIS